MKLISRSKSIQIDWGCLHETMRDQVFFVPSIESFQVFRTVKRSEGRSSNVIFCYLLSFAKFKGGLVVYLIDCLANDCLGTCLEDIGVCFEGISMFLDDSYSAYEFLLQILLTIVSPQTISSFLAFLTDSICLLIQSKLKFISTNSSPFSIMMFSLLLGEPFEGRLFYCWIYICWKQCSYVEQSAFFLFLYLSLFQSKQQVYPLCLGGL